MERFIIRGEHVCLLKAANAYSCDREEAKTRFNNLLMTYHAHCGLSRIFYNLAECRRAFAQSCAALRLGKKVGRISASADRGNRIFLYSDYAVYHMLETFYKEMDLFSLLPRKLVQFYENDRKNGGTDVELLTIFMNTGMSMAATAQVFFLHRNSVAYRIKRIEDQLGLDFSQTESILNVLLLLKIIRYLE